MKKKKNKWLWGSVIVFLCVGIGLLGYRIWNVNQKAEMPRYQDYKMGDMVELGGDYIQDPFEMETRQGYAIKVISREIYTIEEYLDKYGCKEKMEALWEGRREKGIPQMVMEVHVLLKNENKEDRENSGITPIKYTLCGQDYELQMDSELLLAADSRLSEETLMGFRLQPGTEMEFYFPFSFRTTKTDRIYPVEKVDKESLYLILSKYPNIKRIKVS